MALVRKALGYTLALYSLALLVSMAGMEIFGWISALLAIALLAGGEWRRYFEAGGRQWFDIFLLGYLGIVILGAFLVAPEPPVGQGTVHVIGTARWVLLFFLLRFGLWETDMVYAEKVFRGLAVAAGLVGVYGVIQHYTGVDIIRGDDHRAVQQMGFRPDGTGIFRSAGFFSSPIRFGNSFGLFGCLLWGCALVLPGFKKWDRYLYIVAAVLVTASLVTTLTRGVWLGLIASLLMMGFYSGKRMFANVAMSLIAIIVLVPALVAPVRSRGIAMLKNMSEDDSRVKIWRATWQMFKENPLLGVGNNQNEYLIEGYYKKMAIADGQLGHAHNMYLQVLSGTGVFGFICYLCFMIGLFLVLHQLLNVELREAGWKRGIALGGMGAWFFMQVSSLTEPTFKHAEVNHIFLFIMAVMVSLYVLVRKKGVARA